MAQRDCGSQEGERNMEQMGAQHRAENPAWPDLWLEAALPTCAHSRSVNTQPSQCEEILALSH